MDRLCAKRNVVQIARNNLNYHTGFARDPQRQATCERNNRPAQFDLSAIRDLCPAAMALPPPAVRHGELQLAACATCQPCGAQRKKSSGSHGAAVLLGEFGRLVAAILPAYVLVEHVPGTRGRQAAARFVDSAARSTAIATSACPGSWTPSTPELPSIAAAACWSRHATAFPRYALPLTDPLGNRTQ